MANGRPLALAAPEKMHSGPTADSGMSVEMGRWGIGGRRSQAEDAKDETDKGQSAVKATLQMTAAK